MWALAWPTQVMPDWGHPRPQVLARLESRSPTALGQLLGLCVAAWGLSLLSLMPPSRVKLAPLVHVALKALKVLVVNLATLGPLGLPEPL